MRHNYLEGLQTLETSKQRVETITIVIAWSLVKKETTPRLKTGKPHSSFLWFTTVLRLGVGCWELLNGGVQGYSETFFGPRGELEWDKGSQARASCLKELRTGGESKRHFSTFCMHNWKISLEEAQGVLKRSRVKLNWITSTCEELGQVHARVVLAHAWPRF